mgnify:CR=1 FL=1
MKKILVLFVLMASIFSFITVFNQTDREEFTKIQNMEDDIAKPFVIPQDIYLSGPDDIYPILCQAADEAEVNIFRRNVHYRSDDRAEIMKYVLLTGGTHYFDVFRLKSGRFLTREDSLQDSCFMSTVSTGDPNQVGVVKDFGGNNLILIRSLGSSYEQFPVDGTYFVEASDEKAFDVFINCFVKTVNKHFLAELKRPYMYTDFVKTPATGGSKCMKLPPI